MVAPIVSAQQPQRRAVLHDDLAAEQVQALDAVRALVDRVQPVVAVELLDVVVAGVAVAAVHLDRQVVGRQAVLRRPALRDRRQHLEQERGPLASGGITGALLVDQPGAVEAQGQRAFDVRLLGQQHAPYVGVLDDRHRRLGRVLAAQRTALQPGPGVLE